MTWNSILTLLVTNGVTLFLGILATRQKSSSSKVTNIRETEGIYAEHISDVWDRLDKVSKELDSTKQERDSLRIKVATLQNTVDDQSSQIKELTNIVESLRNNVKELTEQLKKDA